MARTRAGLQKAPVDDAATEIAMPPKRSREAQQASVVSDDSQQPSSPLRYSSTSQQLPASGAGGPDPDIQMGGTGVFANGVASGHRVGLDRENTSGPEESSSGVIASDATDCSKVDESCIGIEALGQHTKDLFKLMDVLSHLGINTTLKSIPRFAVVGDQSSGKSSIIEAACNIKLPRSQGTCTRCPYQIITSPTATAEWSCKVSLVREYHYVGSLHSFRAEPAEFDDWKKMEVPDIVHFRTVDRESDLEDMLRRAQVAILNPRQDALVYVFNSSALSTESTEVDFSPNIIKLEIEGPYLPNLSFFDLPGAINVHPDDDKQHLVVFVEKLVRRFIRDKGTLVLLARGIDQDLETSTASKFVNEEKAQDRCMGVLTKPDLLDPSRWAVIRSALNGEKFRLAHGYFVTKQLSQQELDGGNIAYAEARRRERDFFSTNAPWSTQLAGFSNQFGIWSLQRAISENFAAHVVRSLPAIAENVERRLTDINVQLAEIPKPSASPVADVHNELATLVKVITDLIDGTCDHTFGETFGSQFARLIRMLNEQLPKMRPKLNLATPGYQPQPISIDTEDDQDENDGESVDMQIETPSKKRKTMTVRSVHHTPETMPQLPHKIQWSAKKEVASDSPQSMPANLPIKLHELKMKLDSGSRSRLPGRISEKAVDNLIVLTLKPWHAQTGRLLKDVRQKFVHMLRRALDIALISRKNSLLYRRSLAVLKDYLTTIMTTVQTLVKQILDRENLKPVYNNKQRLEQDETANLSFLTKTRYEKRLAEYVETTEARINRTMTEAEKRKLQDPNVAKLGSDEYLREIQVMATICAYYDIASSRFVDNLQQCFELHLLETFKSGVQQELFQNLRVSDAQYCAELLAEDPGREMLRVKLMDEKERILRAMNEINAVQVLPKDGFP